MKQSRKFFAALPLLALIIFAPSAHAQIISRGDLFGPGAPPPLFGLQVGLGKHSQQGTFNASCGCTFENGDGNGLLAAVLFELPVDYDWAIGLSAGYDVKHTASSAKVTEQAIVQDAVGNTDSTSFLSILRNSSITARYIVVAPYAQYQFFRMGPFVQAGPSISFLIGSNYEQTRELQSTSTTLNGKPLNDLRFQNGTLSEPIDPAQPIPGASSLRLGLLLSAGYNIQVSERSVFSPLISYDIPLTVISSTNANGWKIGSLYVSAELKFRFD